MKKTISILSILPAFLFGQTYNVSVTNSLLGPVELNFTDTVVQASGQITLTGAVFNTIYEGSFSQTIVTNRTEQFIGINVLTPYLASTNVSGTWTIELKTNAPVAIYKQVGSITQINFSVDSTNDVALAEIILLATTNSITWPASGITWAAGSEPTPTASQYNRIYFEAWRDYVYAVYLGANP